MGAATAKRRGKCGFQMPRIKSNPENSGLESLQKWNNYYINNTFPMIICCVRCGKWRETSEFEENSDVPESWNCSMWTTSDGKKGNCKMPSDVNEDDYVDEDYTPGSLVWAKMDGHPNWPAMVEDDPDEEEYCKDLETDAKYHVVFLGDPPSRRWINAKRLVPFKMPISNEVGRKRFRGKRLAFAVEEAERAFKMTKQNRLLTFSLATRLENGSTESKEESSKVKPVERKRVLQKDAAEQVAAAAECVQPALPLPTEVQGERGAARPTGGDGADCSAGAAHPLGGDQGGEGRPAHRRTRRKATRRQHGESSKIKSDGRGRLLQKYTRGKTTVNLYVLDSELVSKESLKMFGNYLDEEFPPLFR
ncbi:hypothetical protein AVEN_245835-1 [Araneus ventricosus]|uniref:Zinc finger CW-type PWWP domain protein 1 n=1 Tax=Araneus ventricosus TaxID=182803 RepID=A0A4Y2E8I6_ARAVE|nr:hypothetical protein AVEN_245835-1 [Araneus ventricosus]